MFRTIKDVNVSGKKVLVRVDFNVPLDENLKITDDTRMRMAVPTLKHIIDNGGKLIIMSHLGRPKGEVVAKYSLKSVVAHLSAHRDVRLLRRHLHLHHPQHRDT